MKKIASCILACSVIFTCSVPAFAVKNLENTPAFAYNGHGEYSLSRGAISNVSSNIECVSVGESIIAQPTEDEEIYEINEQKYLVLAYDNKYLLCDKVDVDIQNFNKNSEVFKQNNISQYMREDIEKVISKQKELGNDDMKVELYVPSKEDTLRAGTEDTHYYEFEYKRGKYHNMKDITLKYEGLSTKPETLYGDEAYREAQKYKELVILVGKKIASLVPIFDYGMTALEVYEITHGKVTTSHSIDFITSNVDYDRVLKETYAQCPVMGDYPRAGAITHKVWLEDCNTQQYYRSVGDTEQSVEFLNKVKHSDNFFNAPRIAFDNGISSTFLDDFIEIGILGTTVRLLGT